MKKAAVNDIRLQRLGPSVEIRTQGLLNPIQARYQTSPHPEVVSSPDDLTIIAQPQKKGKSFFEKSKKFQGEALPLPEGVTNEPDKRR